VKGSEGFTRLAASIPADVARRVDVEDRLSLATILSRSTGRVVRVWHDPRNGDVQLWETRDPADPGQVARALPPVREWDRLPPGLRQQAADARRQGWNLVEAIQDAFQHGAQADSLTIADDITAFVALWVTLPDPDRQRDDDDGEW